MSANINIGATSYSVQDDWFNVAIKYFKIDPENESGINMLKAGLFGYNNEIQSNEIKNNVYHRNVLYDEHFLNTASFPESIANFAKLYNVDMELATPAKIRATLAINKDDIINSPLLETLGTLDTSLEGFARNIYSLTISKDYIFSIQQIPFRLPYDLQFIVRENEITGEYSVIAKYNTEGESFPFLNASSNPYLKTWNETINEGNFMFVGIDLYQLYKQTVTFSITNNNYMDNLFLTTNFNGQIAYIEAYYIYNGSTTKINAYQNNQYADPNNDTFCYYSIKNNTLELSFGADSNSFRPRSNSEVQLNMYTTYGSSGNFSYNGVIDINFGNDNTFSNISLSIKPITDSSGGKDKYTTTELKNKIIEEAIGRKNIITDTDLNYYFANFNTNTSINGSNIKFFKKRNDILKRVFTGYITMRERSGKVIPTNTAPHLLVNKSYLESLDLEGTFRDNAIVLYDSLNDQFTLFEGNMISINQNKIFIIEKTNDNLDFTYNFFNDFEYRINDNDDNKFVEIPCILPYYSYSYYEENELYEDQYQFDNLTKMIFYRTIKKNNNGEKIEDTKKWKQREGPIDIKCKNNNYKIFVMNDQLCLSIDNENYTDEENMVITEINEYGFKINSDKFLSDSRFIVYAIPYTLKIIEEPILKCNYYITSVYEIYETQLKTINNFVNRNFTINNLQIEKTPNVNKESDSYVFTVDLNTNLTVDELDNQVRIRMIIYNNDGETQGYIEFDRVDEDSFRYQAVINAYNDKIDKNNKINIKGSLLNLDGSLAGGEGGSLYLTDTINMELAILYKDGMETTKFGNFDYMPDMSGFATAVVYDNAKNITLFRNLENYIYSDVVPVSLHTTTGDLASQYYDIKQVPLIEYSYYQQKYDEVLDILDAYDDVSYELINTLENNNSLDLKFTNTYGKSKYWVTDTNNLEFEIENFDYLNVTSIPLDFTIYTNQTIDVTTDTLIKDFISNFVETSNSTGLFAISNLLRALENYFNEIRYVEFGKVAWEDTQKIFNAFPGFNNMTIDEINDYVPEYLNIEKILKYDDSTNDGINLYLKYDYNINVTYK